MPARDTEDRSRVVPMSESESSPKPLEPTEHRAAKRSRLLSWIRLPLRWSLKTLAFIGLLLLVVWCGLAIYFSNLPWWWVRAAMAIAFAGFATWALWITRRRNARWAFAG